MKRYLDLILFNVKASLEADTKQNYLSYIWLLLEPALSALIYFLVFGLFLKRKEPNFIPFLFVGVISYKWFASCVQNGSNSIFANRGLFKKIYFPKILFPWIEVVYQTSRFLIVLSAVVVTYALMGFPMTLNHLYLPVLVFCQMIFCLGLTTLLAAIVPYFLDLRNLISFAVRLGFYPSGVLFDPKRVPEKYRYIVDFNPIAQSLQAFREIIMFGQAPNFLGLLQLLIMGLSFYGIGHVLIRHLDKEYAKIGI